MFSFNSFTEEEVFLFILCYTYNMNLLHIHKLYELSSSLFKSYLKAFLPIFKITNKKLVRIRMQATRVYNLLNQEHVDKPKETELNLVKVLSKHLNCIYVCNNRYITVTDLVGETIQGIKDDNTRVPLETPEEVLNYKHIQIKDCVYTKTSPISYILSKYFSDRNSREVLNLGLADLHKEIEGLVNGEEKE